VATPQKRALLEKNVNVRRDGRGVSGQRVPSLRLGVLTLATIRRGGGGARGDEQLFNLVVSAIGEEIGLEKGKADHHGKRRNCSHALDGGEEGTSLRQEETTRVQCSQKLINLVNERGGGKESNGPKQQGSWAHGGSSPAVSPLLESVSLDRGAARSGRLCSASER